MKQNDVVFTALFGGYEKLNELEIPKNSNTRYICFTDDASLMSKTWEVILINPTANVSPSRASREIKMLGHKRFPKGTRSLYVDNSVRLRVDGAVILDAWLKDCDVAFMLHSSRKTVRGEFFACAAYGLDEQAKIWNQYRNYLKSFPAVLKQKPHWGGMIARVNSSKTDIFMETWKSQFDTFTKRDQLSINVSSMISGIKLKSIEEKNDASIWHEWPVHTNRQIQMRDKTSGRNFRKVRILINGLMYGSRFYLHRV